MSLTRRTEAFRDTVTTAIGARGTGTTVSYDAAANTYTVKDDTGSATFGPADRTATTEYAETYANQVGTVRNDIKIYGNVRAGATPTSVPLQLSYVTYGLWTHSEGQPLPALMRQTFALIGFASPPASIPNTGFATYQTVVSALYSEGGVGSVIPGSATFTANFGTGAILTDLKLGFFERPYSGLGTISANQFHGTFTSPDQFFAEGSFAGGFFGPGASEMGYVFSVHDHVADPYAGASVVPMDTWQYGVVLGAKH